MQETLSLILSYAQGMWRYRWLGLALACIVSIIAWTAVLVLPNEYRASSRVQIDASSVLRPLLKGLAADSESIDRVTIITRVMLSRPSLEQVIRRADLDLQVTDQREMEELLLDVRQRISITRPFSSKKKESSPIIFLDIAFIDKDPKMAHRVVKILVNNLVESALGDVRTDTTDAQQFLSSQIADYERQLKLSEQRLATFKKENVGMLPGQGGDYYARLQSAMEELDTLKTDYDLISSKYNILKSQLDGETAVVGADPRIVSLDLQIQRYQEKLSDLLLIYTENHPDVRGIRRNLEELESKRTTLTNEHDESKAPLDHNGTELNPVYQNVKISLQQTEVEMQSYLTKIGKQEARIEKLRTLVDTVPEVEARLLDLTRDYDVIRQQYLALTQRLESAELSADVRSSNFDMKFLVVEPAIVPIVPVAPDRLMLIGASTGSAIAAGLGIMFLLNMMFPVYITTRELNTETGYPVLGRVSMVFSKRQIFRRRFGYAVYSLSFISFLTFSGFVILNRDTASELSQRILSGLM